MASRKVAQSSQVGEEAQTKPDRTAVTATYLILATGAGLVLCLIPILGTELYIAVNPGTQTRNQLQKGTRIVFDSYSIFNTVIRAVMNKTYQREVRNLWQGCHCAHTKTRNTLSVTH
mgnify:CR=1 FL=1